MIVIRADSGGLDSGNRAVSLILAIGQILILATQFIGFSNRFGQRAQPQNHEQGGYTHVTFDSGKAIELGAFTFLTNLCNGARFTTNRTNQLNRAIERMTSIGQSGVFIDSGNRAAGTNRANRATPIDSGNRAPCSTGQSGADSDSGMKSIRAMVSNLAIGFSNLNRAPCYSFSKYFGHVRINKLLHDFQNS